MNQHNNNNSNNRFPEQDEPTKLHGTTNEKNQQEKYLRDSGKIEDMPSQDALDEMDKTGNRTNKNESAHLTDRSGEEKKEDYINTDERKKDIDRSGL